MEGKKKPGEQLTKKKKKKLYLAPKFTNHLAIVRIPPVRQHLTGKQGELQHRQTFNSTGLPHIHTFTPGCLMLKSSDGLTGNAHKSRVHSPQ